MELIEYIKNNPLYSILAVFFSLGIGYLLKVSLSQRQNIKVAGRNIITAFQPELDLLIQRDDDCMNIMDDTAFRKHEAAIRNNINDLSIFQRKPLKKAWEELAYHNENKVIPFYAMYIDGGSLDKRRKLKSLAIRRIQRIISIVR
jgi:hypothetical protein